MDHGCFSGPSLHIASASCYRFHSWRSELLEEHKTSLFAEQLHSGSGVCRLATGQCGLQNSWDVSWANANLMTVVCRDLWSCCKNRVKRGHVERAQESQNLEAWQRQLEDSGVLRPGKE